MTNDFANQPITVRRIEGLDQDRIFDVQKIEGDYTSLAVLEDKIERYNGLWVQNSKYFTGYFKGQQAELVQALGKRLEKEGYVNKCVTPFIENLYGYIYKVRTTVPEPTQPVTAEQLHALVDRWIEKRGPDYLHNSAERDASDVFFAIAAELTDESVSTLPKPDGQITPELLYSIVEERGIDYTKHILSVKEGAVYAEPLNRSIVELSEIKKIADISLKLIE